MSESNIKKLGNVRQRLGTPVKILCIVASVLVAVIGVRYFGADVKGILIFMAYIIIYVQIPGLLALRLMKSDCEHLSTAIARGFFVGFAINILIYYITVIIRTNIMMYVFGPVLTLLYFVIVVRSGSGKQLLSKSFVAFRKLPVSLYIFVATIFIYSMTNTQFLYIPPNVAEYANMRADFSFHCGFINSLANGYPLLDPWVDGNIIHYHYFTEMLYAMPIRLFGGETNVIVMQCTPYIIAPMFSISLYSFYREMTTNKSRTGLYCLATYYANMFMIRGLGKSWFMYHLFSNVNNAGVGISCMLVIIPMLKSWDNKNRAGYGDLVILASQIMLLTGIKSPVAVVLVGAMIGTFILGALLRAVDAKTVLMVAMVIVAFVIIYINVIGSDRSGTGSGTGGGMIGIGDVAGITFFKRPLVRMMRSIGAPIIVSQLALLIVLMIFMLTAYTVPFTAGYLRELGMVLTKRKDFLFSRITIYATCMAGVAAMLMFSFNGNSQVYFGFAATILFPVVSFWWFEDMAGNHSSWLKTARTIFMICILITSVTAVNRIYKNFQDAQDVYVNRNENVAKYRNVTSAEYDGLTWLRDNTPTDTLIASDRYYSANPEKYSVESRSNNTHFDYAVYSQRRQYLEGSGFTIKGNTELRKKMLDINNSMYDPDNLDRGDVARTLGVGYVVVSKRFNDVTSLENQNYRLCFSNQDMDIYQVVDK